MQHEPDSPSHAVLIETIRCHWGLDVRALSYAPLGFGSYHWVATCADRSRRFVTADHLPSVGTQDGTTADEHFEGLRAAFETAAALRSAGHEFVLAPERSDSGPVLVRMAGEWSLAVYPFVEGTSLGSGPWADGPEAVVAARAIGRLHRAAPPAGLRRWNAVIPGRDAVLAAIEGSHPTDGGPYSEAAYALLTSGRKGVLAALAHYDGLVDRLMSYREPWVVSHGEPHSANFLRGPGGELYLVDWDTVRLAPRERDYAFSEGEAFEAYRGVAKPPPLRPEVQELFGLRWHLQDLCLYARLLLGPHDGNEDDTKSWTGLQNEVMRLQV